MPTMSDRRDWLRSLFPALPGMGELGAGQAPAEATKDDDQPEPSRIPLPRSEPVMPIPGVGFVPPGVPPGLPRVAGDFTSETAPKDLRYPRPMGQIERKVFIAGVTPTVGGVAEFETSFPVRTLRVDNWTGAYLLIRGPEVYVPPMTYGVMIPMRSAPEAVRVMLESPPQVAQPGFATGAVAHLWALEDELAPSPGFTLGNATTVSGTVTAQQGTGGGSANAWAVGVFGGFRNGNQQNVDTSGSAQVKLYSDTGTAFAIDSTGDLTGVGRVMQPSSDNPPAAVVSGANAAATLTFASVAGQTHRLTKLVTSYAGGAVTGNVKVNDGTNNIEDVDITATGPFVDQLPPGGVQGRVGAALTITIAAGGVGVTGKISAAKLTA